MEPIISLKNVTKDYGRGRGIFDVSFDIMPGQVFGYCGTNGSGKTTTIRHIMGFIKQNQGQVLVKGLDAWKNSEEIKKYIGYIPGEINFPDVASGTEFLKIQASMIHKDDLKESEEIIKKMQLDPTANLKRMSKGMKQKTAIVNSFMNDPEILIFDEPTTGLDPLMRQAFINLVEDAKKKRKTIFMSSHMFDELEDTCDVVGLIHNGRLLEIVDIKKMKEQPIKKYQIWFKSIGDLNKIKSLKTISNVKIQDLLLEFEINDADIKDLIKQLSQCDVKEICENKMNLESYFNEIIRKVEQ